MNYLKLLLPSQNINEKAMRNLYELSVKSMLALILSSFFITYLLVSSLPSYIYFWEGLVIVSSLIRMYVAYMYSKNISKLSMKKWYWIFVVMAFFTALLFGTLPYIIFPYIDTNLQLIIMAVLITLVASAMHSLSSDMYIAIGYMSLVLLPLLATVLLVQTTLYMVVALLISIYYMAQMFIMLKASEQIEKMYEQEKEIFLLKEKETLFNNLFKEANLSIFSYDTDLRMIDCNAQVSLLFNNTREALLGKDLNTLENKEILNKLKISMNQGPQTYSGVYKSKRNNDIWVEAKCFPYTDSDGETIGGIAIIENKTVEHEALDELAFLAHHDHLTNLLNRRGFLDYMEKLVHTDKHNNTYSILFYIDLNQFKGINDSPGHTVGDKVLLTVSERLVDSFEDTCSICRLGGDEFIVIVPNVSNANEELQSVMVDYEKKIIDIFNDPFIIDDLHLRMRSSIGMIIIEPKYLNIEEIIRRADITMYQAKNSNGHIAYYNEVLDTKQKELFSLQHDLAYAVEKNEFDMFFQPIVMLKDDTLCTAEALIRWNHPEKGLLSPVEFIPLAIEAGILSQITWWVIDRVCQQIVEWKEDNIWNLEYVSININPQQLVETNFATEFLQKLEKMNLDTKDIMIEITERSLIDNFDQTQDVINHLRSKGVRCAIDDFGIGYSSLSYLKKLSFNTLKIDREFIKDLASKSNDLLLVSTILDIGRQFNYNIVIEGIETKEQKDLLLGLDDNLKYQGYLFSKPLHPDEFSKKFLRI